MSVEELDRYPVRPQMLMGESLLGYFWRFFSSNGHGVPPALRALADAVRSGYVRASQVNYLREVAGARRIEAGLSLELKATQMVFRGGKAPWRKWPTVGRHCPACIFEQRSHRVVFDLPLVDACPVHDLQLISACSACGSSLSWGSLLPGWSCKCGAFIGTMRRVQALAWQGELARWLADIANRMVLEPETPAPNAYRMLELALDIRHLVVGGSDLERYLGRHPLAPDHRRKRPERWEAALVRAPLDRLVIRTRRLLRWAFKADERILIVGMRNPRIDALHDLLKKSGLQSGAPLANLYRAAEVARSELSVMPERASVLYNPAISASVRRAHLVALSDWWQIARTQLRLSEADVVLRNRGYTVAEIVVDMVNGLVLAARRGREVITLRAFKTHWFPASVFSSVDGSIPSFVAALSRLDSAELVFMNALLQQDLADGDGCHD